MMIEVMCRIADGPLRPGELEIAQEAEPLVSWSVITRELSEERRRGAAWQPFVPAENHLHRRG